MTREHLLELPQDISSIPIIQSYMKDAYLQNRAGDAFCASRFLTLIEASINPTITKERLLEEMQHDGIKDTYDYTLHHLYSALPLIYLNALPEAKKIIKTIKPLLAFEDVHMALYIEIEMAVKENNVSLALSLINQYLHEMIPLESRFYALVLKIRLEYEQREFILLSETVTTLKSLASHHNRENEFVIAIYYIAKMKLYNDDHKAALDYFSEVILYDLIEEYTLLSVIGRIEAYMHLNKFHQASIDEAEYEMRMLASTETIQRLFFDLSVELYTKYPNRISLDLYESRRKQLAKAQKPKPVKEKKTSVEPKEEMVVNEVKPAIEAQAVLPTPVKKVYSIENMERLHQMIEGVNRVDYTAPMREALRQAFVALSHFIPPFEAVFFTIDQSIMLYHYKKERLYDKEKDWTYIDNTAIEYVMNHPSVHVFDAHMEKPFKKDVLTQKNQSEAQPAGIVLLPILKEDVLVAGVLVYVWDEAGIHDTVLDLILAFKGILSNQFFMANAKSDHSAHERMTLSLLEKHHLPILRNIDHQITLNASAKALLHLPKNINEIDYFSLFKHVEELNAYKQRLKHPLHEVDALRYTLLIQDKEVNIHDKIVFGFTPSKAPFSVSYLEDVTHIEALKAQTEVIKYKGNQAGLLNEEALLERLSDSLASNKVSLMLFELDEQKMIHELYGLAVLNEVREAFCSLVLHHFKDATIYEYINRYAVIVEGMNDKRTLEKMINRLGEKLEREPLHSKHKLYAKWSVGVIRYPVSTQEKQADKLLRYLELTLSKAKRDKADQYSYEFFDQEDYKRDVFEHTLINHMSEAVEQFNLNIAFVQAIDIVSNRVRHYEPVVRMTTYDVASSYIYALASKRGWSVHLDRYVIKKTLEEVKNIYAHTQKYIKVNIPITIKTFKSRDFMPYMLDVLVKSDIPRELISLELTQVKSSEETDVYLKIKEFKDFHIAVGVNQLDSALVWPVSHVKIDLLTKQLTNPKVVAYFESIIPMLHLQGIDIIFSQANHDDLLKVLKHLKADAVMGKNYSKHIQTQELIEKIGGMSHA